MPTKKNKRQPDRRVPSSSQQRTAPALVTPMAAQVVKRLTEGDDWIYEVLAARGLRLGDRVSLWSLGNMAHNSPEAMELFESWGVRRGGDRWSPFVDAVLGHL